MRVLFFGNNYVGYQILEYLKSINEDIVGLVLHPNSKAKFKSEIINLFPDLPVINGDVLNEKDTIIQIQNLKLDLIISIYFGYILPLNILKIPMYGAFNLHPAYLPYNKGANPNVWSIIENTPAGVSLHIMDENIDTGPIIARKLVTTDFSDTGKSLYEKLEKASLELFRENWALIKNNSYSIIETTEKGTFHYVRDMQKFDEIDIYETYKAFNLLNILRARTFPPYKSSFITYNGIKYYIEIKITKED